jgi:outer membrane protein, heavy metal efflux system
MISVLRMRSLGPRRVSTCLALLLLGGCASTSPKPGFKDVAKSVEARTGHRVVWDQNTTEDREVAKAIDKLLAEDVTADTAVQVALLGSPRLRSSFEELSIAQSDLVQAGLLRNPVFTVGRTGWEQEHISPNLWLGVEQDFMDIATMPMRKRVAATELEATKLEVGDEVLKLASEVRSAFFMAEAALQVTAMRRLVNETAEISASVAKSQAIAGNMSDLALSGELALASQTRIDLKRSEGEAAVERERLVKLMGVWGTRTAWKSSAHLPDLPEQEVSLERLEALAIEKRLDVAAARREVQALDYSLSLSKTTRWTGMVTVNVEAGRLRGSKRISFGPSVGLEIPLFDQRQAAIARLEAFKRQAENNLQALSIDVRSDVRAACARVTTSRALVEEFSRTMVPLRESVVRFTQQQYDAMLLGVYQLLQARQMEFETYRQYIEVLRDYWIARSDLERAVGMRLPRKPAVEKPASPSPAPKATPTQAPATPNPHEGHSK